ncbi:hypothetical protein BR93DRAFT_928796 [Coniochaeta sp. PMI_546]|nr:hypothetical protein BR93DRAFT_928796 [Coniochaeta sp. PMI_546]
MGIAAQAIVGMTIAFSYTLFGKSLIPCLHPPSIQPNPPFPSSDSPFLAACLNTFHRLTNPGNAITQSFMGVPALLIDFPPPTSPAHPAAARHLGRQWPVFWAVGNVFFRPISTLGIFGYAFAAYHAAAAAPAHGEGSSGGLPRVAGDWRLYAVSAACHLVTVVHSAVNMQPINAKIDALKDQGVSTAELEKAEYWARRWARLNLVRLVMPLVAGSLALSQAVRV